MLTALFIGLWAYLFCMPLSEPGEVFGRLRGWLYDATHGVGGGRDLAGYTVWTKKAIFPEWLYKPLIGCPKCHAGQIALWWQVFCFYKTGEFSLPFVLTAIATAYALETWHLIVDTWLHR